MDYFEGKPTKDDPARRVWLECSVLVFLLALAAALRIPGLFQGFWGDELYTLCGGMWPLDKLLSGKMAASTFTPLTWLVVKATIALFPPSAQFRFPVQMPLPSDVLPMHLSEATLRLPFFFMSLVTLVVLFLLVRKYFGLNAAFWAGLFLAVSPEHVGYSSEVRFYGMVCLAGAVLLYGVQLVLDGRGWKGWALTALGLLLGLPTHLSFFFVTAGIMAGAAVSLFLDAVPWRRRVGVCAGLGVLCAVVVAAQVTLTACFSPAPLGELAGLFGNEDAGVADTALETPKEAAADKTYERPAQKFTLTPRTYINICIVQRFLSCDGPACKVMLAVLLLAGCGGLYARRRSLLFMALGVFCSPIPLFFVQVNHKWLYRYFLFEILLFAVLAGVGMDTLFRLARRLVGAARPRLGLAACAILAAPVVLVYAPSLAAGMERAPNSHADGGMKRMSETLAQNLAQDDRLLFLQPFKVRLSVQLIPYYLQRMRPDWYSHGVINKMTLCNDAKELGKALAKMPGDGFWVVSFDANNRDVTLNKVLAESGGRLWSQFPNSSLWRIGGDERHRPSLLAENMAAAGAPGIELPREGSVVDTAYRVVVPENSEQALKTPTVLFPVVRDESGQPSTGLKADCSYTLRFRLQLENVVAGSNRTRTFRVMLFARESTIDLMYADGTADGQDYTISFVPGEYLPDTLSDVKIGFGIRGGTGAFRVGKVALQRGSVPSR